MIRDYPDVVPPSNSTPPSPKPLTSASLPTTPTIVSPKPLPVNLPPPTAGRTGPIPPPPRHPAAAGPQTTYTPYIPRSRRGVAPPHTPNPLSPTGQPIPIITSSAQGGITTRHTPTHPPDASAQAKHTQGPSAALLDKVRALDALPRLGALRTLDLKGNDLRVSFVLLLFLGLLINCIYKGGITYMAQVLKRNRTLKVLNLSENKLDVQCLVSIAEALVSHPSAPNTSSITDSYAQKYNSNLETLDLSKNPCCGPDLDGVGPKTLDLTYSHNISRYNRCGQRSLSTLRSSGSFFPLLK